MLSEFDLSNPRPSAMPGSNIVVADDDRLTREAVCNVLKAHGYNVEPLGDGQAAVERVARGGVHLVLLDIMMPKLSGLEACRLIKGMTSDSFLPVVLLTVKTDSASRVEGLRIGADDYVCKPFDERELIARVEGMLRIKKLHDHVAEARAKLEQLSMHDELTGLYNYRYLHPRMNEEFKRAERYHDPLACLVIDIDRLEAHNDAGGRAHGDRVIHAIADSLRRSVREVDVVARFGGDEFLVLLPSTHFAGSVTVAERIWREASESSLGADLPQPVRVSLSLGVALFPSRDIRTKDQLLRAADSALHHAKREGKNRVCVYQQQGQLYTPVSGDGEPERRSSTGQAKAARERASAKPASARAAGTGSDVPPRRGSE
jgi:two-component system cell cycle response regulator